VNGCTVGSDNITTDQNNVAELHQWGNWECFYRMDKCVDGYVVEGKLLQKQL
jgi:hypothetical protein